MAQVSSKHFQTVETIIAYQIATQCTEHVNMAVMQETIVVCGGMTDYRPIIDDVRVRSVTGTYRLVQPRI